MRRLFATHFLEAFHTGAWSQWRAVPPPNCILCKAQPTFLKFLRVVGHHCPLGFGLMKACGV